MYKRISTFNFSSFGFVEQIDSLFEYYTNLFINEFESSLLEKYVFSTIEQPITYSENEIEVLKKMLKTTDAFQIRLGQEAGLEILNILLTLKLEEFLKIPFNTSEQVDEKKNELEVISFQDFVSQKDDLTVEFDIDAQKEELDQKHTIFEAEYYNRPQYFLLYRARNIITRRLVHRNISNKAANHFVKKIKEQFKMTMYSKIIKESLGKLETEHENEIYKEIEKYLIGDFLNDFRLGRTEVEGNKLIEEIKQKIQQSSLKEHMKEKMFKQFQRELKDEEGSKNLVKWTETYKTEVRNQFSNLYPESVKDSQEITSFPLPLETIQKIILGSIFTEQNFKSLINAAYKKIEQIEKTQLIAQVYYDYLRPSTFSVALCVNNVRSDDVFLRKSLHHGITVMSNEMFKSWQYDLFEDIEDKRIIMNYEENKNATWFIVDGVKCAVSDTEKAYFLAKENIKNLLNFLYHFISREDQINYEIIDPYLVFNQDINRVTVGRMSHPGKTEPKNVDELEPSLLEFTHNFFKSHSFERDLVIKGLNLYIDLCRTDDVQEKIYLQSEIFKTMLDTRDISTLSKYCSIIISGTNYDKDDVTYGEMRRWLIEDFLEFFYVADRNGMVPLKEQINERFKVFCKIIIRTILFNLVSINEDSKHGVNDVIDWILVINPNKESIVRRSN